MKQPIHEGLVDGQTLHFHAPPHAEPDFAWLELDDLLALLDVEQEKREIVLRMLQEDWSQYLRTIATTRGIKAIVPHHVVQDLTDVWIEQGWLQEESKDGYLSAGMKASKVLTMGFTANDRRSYMFAALARGRDA